MKTRHPKNPGLTVGDPALGEDIDGLDDENDGVPTPTPDARTARLEARILELQAQLTAATPTAPDFPMDPDALIKFDVPLSPTGFAVELNGKKIVGPGPWPRRVLDQVLHVLSVAQQSERERVKDRGVGFLESRLDSQDYGSRAMRRRQGRHVL